MASSSSSAPHPAGSSSTVGAPAALPLLGTSNAAGTASDGPGSPKSMQSSIHSHQGGKAHGKKDAPAKKPKPSSSLVASMAQLELDPKPAYFDHRIQMFERLYAEQQERAANAPREPITVTLPDGSALEHRSWEITPLQIAQQLSASLAKRVVIAKVDGQLWDLERPLEASCKLELLDFEHDEGKKVFWHSAAHVLGEAAERHYGCHLCLGPPTDDGFFYEMGMPDGQTVLEGDYAPLKKLAKAASDEKQPFQRLVASKADLLEMFNYNKYKQYMIQTKVPDGASTTVYRCGPMIDLCVGPHIPNTNRIKAFDVLKNSASYFLGNKDNDSLQRIYGVAFPEAKQLKEYHAALELARERDHRRIGQQQELFFFHELTPGSCMWLPHGARIYNTLVELMRSEYHTRGFQEVISANMYNVDLWKRSGHYKHYKDDMFSVNVEKEEFALKPMNCPGHCLIFGVRERSYRELPLRMAEFGVLHRNEASGALTGLTRVRRFAQDDAHIFCMPSQVEDEVAGAFDFLRTIYGIFGFEYKLVLSTRPAEKLGDDATWDQAEDALAAALDKFVGKGKWDLNEGDGAFYGPKIDISVFDALKRKFQCATIQLDFQLPENFELTFRTAEGHAEADASLARKRPVMIHRAIYGSLERFIAILCEHYGGKWPFWLSPRQCIVVPVTAQYRDYASEVAKLLSADGFFAEADLSSFTLDRRIRSAELSQTNFILVVGGQEESSRSVNVRNRDDPNSKKKGTPIGLDAFLDKLRTFRRERTAVCSL